MKVTCIINEFLPKYEKYYQEDQYGVSVGTIYTVLAIETKWVGPSLADIEYFYVIIGDSNTPRFCPASLFRIEDPTIPCEWSIDLDAEARMFRLSPRPWLAPGFWEDFEDRHAIAVDSFHEIAEKLLTSTSR